MTKYTQRPKEYAAEQFHSHRIPEGVLWNELFEHHYLVGGPKVLMLMPGDWIVTDLRSGVRRSMDPATFRVEYMPLDESDATT